MVKAFIILAALFSGEAKNKKVNVNIKESVIKWTGEKIIGDSHRGTLKLKEGFLQMDGKKLSGGAFVIDMNTLNNEDLSGESKGRLEGHLKSDDFFSVATYPTAEFVITNVKSTARETYEITGDMTIKGITESISLSAKMSVEKSGYIANAQLTFDRTKFNVKYNSGSFFENLGDKIIKDNIDLEIMLVVDWRSFK